MDRIESQNRLFSRLSEMFASEVPLYDKSLLVNQLCNRAVCDLLALAFPGFEVDDLTIQRTSGERHGAIRIGRRDEYRWMRRLFACFAMEPHNFYDMANVGAKSQPIMATAFRSRIQPEHRVFCSLLLTDYFDAQTQSRLEKVLARRQVVSDVARGLIEKSERTGRLSESDSETLIEECTMRIFKWTGRAIEYDLYHQLCQAGFKIAADIACFQSHHLNHLTPNTFCIDVYTSAMKYCLDEITQEELEFRLGLSLRRVADGYDAYRLRLLFRHQSLEDCLGFSRVVVSDQEVCELANRLVERLGEVDVRLSGLNHAGFKDSTEGPSYDTPVLLRQDAYKALSEPVTFFNSDGTTLDSFHTARFGEIEQRGFATTSTGRELYDACLKQFEDSLCEAGIAPRDWRAQEKLHVQAFSAFPKSLPELVQQGLVHARYEPTATGLAAAGELTTADLWELAAGGYVRFEGMRYEDFLPVSAAGIFASNLNQYGTATTAAERPVYSQSDLEAILDCPIIDAGQLYQAIEADSILQTLRQLQVLELLPPAEIQALEAASRTLSTDNGASFPCPGR